MVFDPKIAKQVIKCMDILTRQWPNQSITVFHVAGDFIYIGLDENDLIEFRIDMETGKTCGRVSGGEWIFGEV